MKWDLKTPCKNCPFTSTKDGIRFVNRARAEEIEESAYRHGFPCHLSAVNTGDEDPDGGFVFGPNTQHCAGAIIMFLKDGYNGNVPFERLTERQQDRITSRLDMRAPVYDGVDEFLKANTTAKGRR